MNLETESNSSSCLPRSYGGDYPELCFQHFVIVVGQLEKLGGAERQAILLGTAIRRALGAKVSFLAWGGRGRVSEMLDEAGIPYFTFPLRQSGFAISNAIRLIALVRFLRATVRPDIFLPFIGFNCKIIALAYKLSRAKYTWWNQRDEGRDLYGSRLERWALQHVPSIVSNSYEGRDFLANTYRIPPDSIRIIPNGVEIPPVRPTLLLREKLGISEQSFLVCMVANLTAYKDHETLLRALAELRSLAPAVYGKTHLLLAGREGETTVGLKVLAFDLGIAPFVRIVGPVDDIPGLLQCVDLVVHSSTTEGCPNAVLEAMANGRAVVGTDISGIRQALGPDAAAACLAPPGDAQSLARRIHEFLSNDSLRLKWESANRERIREHFSIDAMVENVLDSIAPHLIKEK